MTNVYNQLVYIVYIKDQHVKQITANVCRKTNLKPICRNINRCGKLSTTFSRNACTKSYISMHKHTMRGNAMRCLSVELERYLPTTLSLQRKVESTMIIV